MIPLRSRCFYPLDPSWSLAIVAHDPQHGSTFDVYLSHASGSRVPMGSAVIPRAHLAHEVTRLAGKLSVSPSSEAKAVVDALVRWIGEGAR